MTHRALLLIYFKEIHMKKEKGEYYFTLFIFELKESDSDFTIP